MEQWQIACEFTLGEQCHVDRAVLTGNLSEKTYTSRAWIACVLRVDHSIGCAFIAFLIAVRMISVTVLTPTSALSGRSGPTAGPCL